MTKFIIPRSIKGLIFDCDGVLVDSEPLSCRALNILFENHFGIDIGTDYSPVIGTSLKDSISYYFNKYNINPTNLSNLLEEKEKIYKQIAKNNLKPYEGIEKFLDNVKKWNYYISVASSGSYDKIQFSLTETNLIRFFDQITSSSEVNKGKPEPDLFLKAADKMHLDPSACAVFEDSISGIKAATNAGMFTIGICNTFSYEKLSTTQADVIINSIKEISIPYVLK